MTDKVLEECLQNIQNKVNNHLEENREVIDLVKEHLNKNHKQTTTRPKTIPNEYTLPQLSKYFGVSMCTIQEWFELGRFVGVQITDEKKNIRISENTEFVLNAGGTVLVKDVINLWCDQESKSPQE